MGFDSAHGDGFFRWRNERFGWRQTVSNILRNAGEELGTRSERWNRAVYDRVVAVHERLGIDVNDPNTTWRWTEYRAPRNTNHEADANNLKHLALLALVFMVLTVRAIQGRDRERWLYFLALILGFVCVCAYLKWQLFLARLFLPLFVAASPLAASLTEGVHKRFSQVVAIAVGLFLVDSARLPLLENWTRPLRGPRSIFRVARTDRYFADMTQWGNASTYRKTADLVLNSQCEAVGIDITNMQLEYPVEALVREKKPGVLFLHTDVKNASRQYRQPVDGSPCAVVCLDCAGDSTRRSIYGDFPEAVTVDRFVVFLRGGG